jgi:predicted solute-binding protein
MQATTENRDYQRKDLEIIVQYFEDDKIEFNRNLNDVRDTLQSEIFINSIPILDIAKNVVKYVLVKSGSVTVIDDILSIRMISDFTDDVVVTNPTYDLMGVLHLQKEC